MATTASLDQTVNPPVLTLSGVIDERSELLKVDVSEVGDKLIIDFQGIIHINSVGTHRWITWVKKAAEGRQLIFRRCPRSIIIQMNLVADFLPSQGKLESFYVPYYCEDCDEESEVLFTIGKDVEVLPGNQLRVLYEPHGTCKNPECNINIDINGGQYFRFLTR